jgi:hypothetical protein
MLLGARHSNAPDPKTAVHLLIAPDAILGAKLLGISFVQPQADTGAELSDSLELIYSGSKVYILRLKNGKVVLFSKDHVWAIAH